MINKIKTKLSELLSLSNSTTGRSDTDLSTAMGALIHEYGANACPGGVHIIDNSKEANLANSYTARIYAQSGYTLAGGSVSVTMGGTDITSTAYSNGVITVNNLTGDLNIVATARALEAFSVDYNLEFCSSSNTTSTAYENSSYNCTLIPDDGYELKTITVFMGNQDITNSAYSDGEISIVRVTGNVSISAVCGEISTYPASYSFVGVTLSNQPDVVERGSSFSTTITALSPSLWLLYNGCVTVTMGGVDITSDACILSSDCKSADVSISTVTGDIDIKVSVENAINLTYSNERKAYINSSTGAIATEYSSKHALLGRGSGVTAQVYGAVYLLQIPVGVSSLLVSSGETNTSMVNAIFANNDTGSYVYSEATGSVVDGWATLDITGNNSGYMVLNMVGSSSWISDATIAKLASSMVIRYL